MDDLKRDMNDLRHGITEFPEHNIARDEKTDPQDEARTLQDDIVGQKTTAEGTAGADGRHAPTGEAVREKTPPKR